MTDAYQEAITYLQAHPDETVALAVFKLGMKSETALKTYQALAKDFTPAGTIQIAGLKAYADELPALDIAAEPPAESKYYNPHFTPVS